MVEALESPPTLDLVVRGVNQPPMLVNPVLTIRDNSAHTESNPIDNQECWGSRMADSCELQAAAPFVSELVESPEVRLLGA